MEIKDTTDCASTKVTGEHNPAELLAHIEELRSMVKELEGKVDELEKDMVYLQNQVWEREHHMNRAATRLVWGEQNTKEALQILTENVSPRERVTP